LRFSDLIARRLHDRVAREKALQVPGFGLRRHAAARGETLAAWIIARRSPKPET